MLTHQLIRFYNGNNRKMKNLNKFKSKKYLFLILRQSHSKSKRWSLRLLKVMSTQRFCKTTKLMILSMKNLLNIQNSCHEWTRTMENLTLIQMSQKFFVSHLLTNILISNLMFRTIIPDFIFYDGFCSENKNK